VWGGGKGKKEGKFEESFNEGRKKSLRWSGVRKKKSGGIIISKVFLYACMCVMYITVDVQQHDVKFTDKKF
jgi:hypothetical protein